MSEQHIEEWRPVVGYEGYYEVSSHGRVRSTRIQVRCKNNCLKWRPSKIRKPDVGYHGHLRIHMSKNGEKTRKVLVHHMVLEAFVGPRPDGMDCCHFPDRSPGNNRVENLRWDTPKANSEDAQKHGTWAHADTCGARRLSSEQVREIRAKYIRYSHKFGKRYFAEKFGVSQDAIHRVVHGLSWKTVK